jgi:hypothetical protein
MSISQAALGRLFGYAFLLGAILAFCYDLLRLTRIFFGVHYCRRGAKRLHEIRLPFIKPYGRRTERRALGIVVFFEDLLFCVFAAVAMILLFYQANNGNFRFPTLLAAGAGFLLYRGTVGRLVMLFSEVIAFFIETCVRYLLFFSTLPFRFLARQVKKWLETAAKRVGRAHRRSGRKHFTERQLDRARRDACGLIPEELPKKRMPKRGKYIAKGKKTIQSHTADACSSGGARRRVGRRIRQ